MRPLILISNDDGYQAKGIRSLTAMLEDIADIIVCAPDDARSGFSCAFSATIPLKLTLREKREGVTVYSCNGAPVDCVKMALQNICERRPDMIIGGINHGDNASVNAHYSGTMGVTIEGCLKYIPSVAYSLCDHREDADFEPLRPYIRKFTEKVLKEGLPKGICLNINFPLLTPPLEQNNGLNGLNGSPLTSYRGVRVCRMGFGSWQNETTKCHHPRGYDYWWMVGHYHNDEPEATDTDRWALDNGYVAITPTQIDITAYAFMNQKADWENS